MTPEAFSNWNTLSVCSCPCSHKQKAYILETAFLCLFVTAQGALHLAASGRILLEAPPGPQLALRTVGSQWEGQWDAQFTPGGMFGQHHETMEHCLLRAPAFWGATHFGGWQNKGYPWTLCGNPPPPTKTGQPRAAPPSSLLGLWYFLLCSRQQHGIPIVQMRKPQLNGIHNLSRWHSQWLNSGASTGLSDYGTCAHFSILLSMKLSPCSCHIAHLLSLDPLTALPWNVHTRSHLCLTLSPLRFCTSHPTTTSQS